MPSLPAHPGETSAKRVSAAAPCARGPSRVCHDCLVQYAARAAGENPPTPASSCYPRRKGPVSPPALGPHVVSQAREPRPAAWVLLLRAAIALRCFGRAGERGDRRGTALDHGGDVVEVARAHFLLVADEGVTALARSELRLLHLFHVGAHAALHVVLREIEHVEPHRVDTGQRDELVLVAHRAQLALELGDGGVVEILLPVERGRAVVRQKLVRIVLARS